MELVLYSPEKNEIQLYRQYQDIHWSGKPYVVWRTLETAIGCGWIVIGEL